MAVAYVLINVESGSEDEILDRLVTVDEVKEVYFVYGVYDIIVKVVAENIDKIREIITWKIRRLEKVKSTVTMIAIKEAIK
ncbi:MAG: Lrp/AsnC ligand binding domain-containing protein [Candidatus Methanomethylicia archaeon]